MHELPCNSTDYGCSEPPPIFPSRPCLKLKHRSHSLQRKAPFGELAESVVGSLSLVALMCAIVASTLFGSIACAQTASRSPSVDQLAKFIAEASTRFAVPAHWIRAVIRIESAGDAHSISPRGAMGLMQLMPST